MEHGALTPIDWAHAAHENLIHTYLGLGAAITGARPGRAEGVHWCSAPVSLGYCNFAIVEDGLADHVRDAALSRVQPMAMLNPVFRVFGLTSGSTASQREAFRLAGFSRRHTMVQMAWHGRAPDVDLRLREAGRAVAERRDVARYMVSQFFARQERDVRQSIVDATTNSPHRLFAFGAPDDVQAAVMLSESPNAIGLYNLCVTPAHRSRGLGRKIVAAVQRLAAESSRAVVLQCEPALEPWYKRCEFARCGLADVYDLAFGEDGAIIQP